MFDDVLAYLQSAGPGAFFGTNALISAIAVIPGGASGICIGAGALYGLLYGTLLYVSSSAFGALIAFYLARSTARPLVLRALKSYDKKLKAMDKAIMTEGIKIVILLRLSPVTPFVACNFLLGLTAVSGSTYALGTLIGLVPSSFVYVYVGAVGAQASGGDGTSDAAGLMIQGLGLVATAMVTWKVVKIAQQTLDAAVGNEDMKAT